MNKIYTYYINLKDMNYSLISRLREFLEAEARSCSMDFGCITPLYVYRAWGGCVAIEEIAKALPEARRMP